MDNKNRALEQSLQPQSLTEGSPRDYEWESFSPIQGLPEISHFGYFDIKEARLLGKHLHPDSFEFMFIEKGKASWEINGFHYETKAGDIFYTRPKEYHSASNNILEPCRLWTFGLRMPTISEDGIEHPWMQQNPGDIKQITDGLHTLPRVTFLGHIALNAFRRLAKTVQQPEENSQLVGKVVILDLLLQLFEVSKIEKNKMNNALLKIEELINQLTVQWDYKLSIEEMAEKVGISTPYFYRLFQEYTHMSPRAYLERIRVKEACRRLTETEAPIISIAMDMGFATSQHFAAVFRRLTGRTPTNCRQNKLNIDMNRWLEEKQYLNHDFINLGE
jgi:AraC-like DNA-binding protein/mannose-6-phosphate isomerase-like protein (cupin superfamily)